MASVETTEAPGSSALAEIAGQTPGARFLKADLQVHTPIDPRFEPKFKAKDERARLDFARSYMEAAQERGIELVGITEHNDVSWMEPLRYAAQGLGIHLLPGFEIESSEGIHVLCLFDPETSVESLEDTLAQLGLTKEKRATKKRLELRADREFSELVAFVQDECRGICIAAHADSDKGLLNFGSGGARADRWKCADLLAVQISRPADELPPGLRAIAVNDDPTYQRDKPPACLLTSDARSFAEIGAKATWLKLDRIGVDGLRQAFLDPESRLSLSDPADLRKGPRLLAVAWAGGFLDGIAIPLNTELNTLIGGKGTGKSTIIESIRFAFGLEARTEEVRRASAALRESTLQSGCKVSLLVDTGPPAPKRYLIERTVPHAPVVRDETGMALPELDPTSLVRPDIYGQKEIYEVAQSTEARLSLLDAFAAEDLKPAAEREQVVLDQLQSNAALILDSQKRKDDAEARLQELPSLEEWRTRFREAGFEERLRERRLLDREERLLDSAGEVLVTAERVAQRLNDSRPGAPTVNLKDEEALPNPDLVDQMQKLFGRIADAWDTKVSELQGDLARAREDLSKIRDEWGTRRAARQAEFDRALRELQARMPDVDPERYLDVERRIEQLTPLRAAVKQLAKRLDEAIADRTKLLVELDEIRGEKHRIRARAAEELTTATGGNVKVELAHRAERGEFLAHLTGLKTGARSDALHRMVEAEDFNPRVFTASVREGALQGKFGLPDGQAALLERSLDDRLLLELDHTELSDKVSIGLDIGLAGVREYRPLARLSPGQRSTAILLMIMQASDAPLLIDQPEDDLDNRFIYDDIVKRLRAMKPSRQFLVATHNANIPVLGDAEQIVVLDASDRGGELVARGAIDDKTVRESAELILEGGEEAFARRREKYGW